LLRNYIGNATGCQALLCQQITISISTHLNSSLYYTRMRYIHICILLWNGKTEWRVIPWGKKHLDLHRKDGDIIMYRE